MNAYRDTTENPPAEYPKLYGKLTIYLLAAFGNTFISAIFYSINLAQIGRKSQIPPVLIFGFFWNAICLYFLHSWQIKNLYLRLLLPNLLGGLIFISFLWDYHCKDIARYTLRKPLAPILTILSLWALAFAFRSYLF